MKYQKRKLRKKSFITEKKRINYVGIKLLKEVKDLFSVNYNMLMKEIEDNIKR